MRLIGTFDTEKEAYTLYSFLLKEGVQNVYEPYHDEQQHKKRYRIWVFDEDDLSRAIEWLEKYKENPDAPEFQHVQIPLVALTPPAESAPKQNEDLQMQLPPLPPKSRRKRFQMALTQFIIGICVFLFLWNDLQEAEVIQEKGALALQIAFTPLQRALIYDYPSAFKYIDELISLYPIKTFKDVKELPPDAQALFAQAEQAPSWKGLYEFFREVKKVGWEKAKNVPLFEKIRQGEFWRLFTPCLLHRDFLHILFNMAWAWILGKQIEERVRRWKIVLLIVILGVISNTAQYLVSGPYFLGYSGVVVGLAGFIWMRQRQAPWEGYPLAKGTALFLLFFVLAMFILELLTFGLQMFSIVDISANIANTAHIVGGLCGLALGRLSFFARGKP
ncbi:MAG: rhomboid family intramembrane serine protease [Parachlamydiales bacterium]